MILTWNDILHFRGGVSQPLEKETMGWLKRAQEVVDGDGDCMKAAVELMMRHHTNYYGRRLQSESGDAVLVHAMVSGRGEVYGYRFPHAWVETGDTIHDHSGGRERKIRKLIYYAIGNIDVSDPGAYRRYTYEEMKRRLRSTGHYGPWDLDENLGRVPGGGDGGEDDSDGSGGSGGRRKDAGGSGVRLGDVVRLGVGMEDADFWIVRRGTPDEVGRPTSDWGPEKIGVKVMSPEVMLPRYLFYAIMHLHSSGRFREISRGTTRLVSIRTDDIAKIGLVSR